MATFKVSGPLAVLPALAFWRAAMSLLVAVALSPGCALVPGLRVAESASASGNGYQLVNVTTGVIREQREQRAVKDNSVSPPGFPSLVADQPSEEYVIGPGDVLTIVVWEHPELTNPTGEFRDPVSGGRLVSSDGTIFYPYIGPLKAAGKTVVQVRAEITETLSRVIRNPQVDVRVAAFRSQRVQVTGEVKQPGLVALDDTPKGVLEAIHERGGLGDKASRREVRLIRGGQLYRVDLANLLSGASPAHNPALQPGDIIHVPINAVDQVFVLGEVPKPGPVVIQQEFMSLTEALTATEGLDRLTANDSGVLVFRRATGAAREQMPTVFRVDLSEPHGLLLAGEFELQPRDVVYVKATAFAQYNAIINQLLPTISALFQLDVLTNRD